VDDLNTKCESKSEDLKGNIESLMLEETRQAFHQRQTLLMSVDLKAFGIIAINAVLISVFSYVLSAVKSDYLVIPFAFIIASVAFLTKCVWPIEWWGMEAATIVRDFGELEYREAIGSLAASYVQLDEMLKNKYKNKYDDFYVGARLAGAALISEGAIVIICLLAQN
jgi:hypothetical protein